MNPKKRQGVRVALRPYIWPLCGAQNEPERTMRTAGVATTSPRSMRGASSLNRSEDARALPYQDNPRHLHTCHIHYARPRHSRAR